uniref:Uncharacterized protein n=1 Tax=Anguilla anguilla TaxID=7936 RepID=A0A0E9Q9I0_ANGAN
MGDYVRNFNVRFLSSLSFRVERYLCEVNFFFIGLT